MFRHRWPKYERVLVNLVDGRAFDALLIDQRGPLLVLADATLYQPGSEAAELDGQVYVERDRVAFIQVQPRGR